MGVLVYFGVLMTSGFNAPLAIQAAAIADYLNECILGWVFK